MHVLLLAILTFYGILSLSHFIFQMLIAHANHRRQDKEKRKELPEEFTYPSVSVIIPSYNENPRYIKDCVESILKQNYPNDLGIFIADDGSKNIEQLQGIYHYYARKGCTLYLAEKNVGKRHVQKIGFDQCHGEIVVTVDSDTVIDVPYGVKNLVESFKDPTIGAATGNVTVINRYDNILTKLIELRYWTAFHQERAAQSFFGVVMCCSGPFAAYRKSLIENVKEKYVSQCFLGKSCTFGDDRHLTNLILEQGYKVVFNKHAKSYTHVPNTLKRYLKQQNRWNKSFYREFFWTIKYLPKHHPFMAYDLIISAILPFLLTFALLVMLYQVIILGETHLILNYMSLLLGVAFLRSLYGYYRTGNREFFIFPIYALMHIFLLIPNRVWAILTINRTHWGTR
ncbi:MAG: Glycosyltransferase, probably involved in cell wall biogenesis [Candidatus Daviesbacteria bacterium GW2011_GWA1_41_61]|uniref:Glycosyltransferase, probably involved in cell wall biogenesis n=1 Tax=Candidatus Daviesbacteria bacterium GW2011_GWA2_40_9 TaxID=1618424 RepID=A0A0G0WFU4_9BACT|nr:MAG: Glycosyltransferase, probably involved in cell wall biogenesis [Candidatus Daviesbacteria bacterium GW2011_GWC1_40_9]KKR83150.1 MAG: Glycosyltransferase, probably involved in cell wall biogenesis [Candidatus Daviesbacteria bacterium GW2011_GWA2_40_9]KKR93497.1 MAG: Glycosyltransferase, probably involved in cell wall biogenesis [Candidatus Daviesbacteria bacterium GW2011_GWB1_41_15]KKS14954.1 MAG: Glycosyltransferase, probably involved in cell wall biogenesis [Candidatus Daviesbacteria ba